jgi:hypothetical protein
VSAGTKLSDQSEVPVVMIFAALDHKRKILATGLGFSVNSRFFFG